eukprot:1136471-Pelagomonas_calceolata.AAC.15
MDTSVYISSQACKCGCCSAHHSIWTPVCTSIHRPANAAAALHTTAHVRTTAYRAQPLQRLAYLHELGKPVNFCCCCCCCSVQHLEHRLYGCKTECCGAQKGPAASKAAWTLVSVRAGLQAWLLICISHAQRMTTWHAMRTRAFWRRPPWILLCRKPPRSTTEEAFLPHSGHVAWKLGSLIYGAYITEDKIAYGKLHGLLMPNLKSEPLGPSGHQAPFCNLRKLCAKQYIDSLNPLLCTQSPEVAINLPAVVSFLGLFPNERFA